MIIDDDMQLEASALADKALEFRAEDDRWAVLEEMLTRNVEQQRERAVEMLTVAAVIERLHRGLTHGQLSKLGWNGSLRPGIEPATFVHELRLAKDVGWSTEEL